MITYTRIKGNRRKFLALTGLTPKEFRILLPRFEQAYKQMYPTAQTLGGTLRKRQAGGGRKSVLGSPEQKLLFALVYVKTYPLQALLGEAFGLSQAQTNYWLHRVLPAIVQALDELKLLPERDPRNFAQHERRQGELFDLTIDGTERRRQRPKNKEKQALHYSGKKKAHTDKNVVIVNTKSKRVGYLSGTYAGKTHDKKIADTESIAYPRTARLRQDTGFQGYAPRVAEICQPKKSRARVS
jgi:hypothetical protein